MHNEASGYDNDFMIPLERYCVLFPLWEGKLGPEVVGCVVDGRECWDD